MATFNFKIISLTCVKRSDDVFQTKDEPYLTIHADARDPEEVRPNRGPKNHEMKKGETATVFSPKSDVVFGDTIRIELYESDHDKFGPKSKDECLGSFTLNAAERSATTRTMKDGKDAVYELKYEVRALGLAGGGDRPGVGGTRVFLNLLALSRGTDASARSARGPSWLRLDVGGRVMTQIDGRRVDEGESALDQAFDVLVTSPMTLRLLEKNSIAAQYQEIMSRTEAWSESPDDLSPQTVDVSTAEGHRYTLQYQFTVK